MRNRVEAYFGMLEQLSAEELDRSATEVAVLEKRNVARLIAHICEISRRNVHLECGYKNLFDYGVRRLNLSAGSVWRRLQVAKVCRRFPQVLVALSQNRLNLTAASLLAPHLSEENVERLVSESKGKSKREVEELLVAFSPKKEFSSSVRREPVGRRESLASGEVSGVSEAGGISEAAMDDWARDGAAEESRRSRPVFEPATSESYNYRFSAGKDFTAKLERFAEVLGIEYPHNHLEEIFEEALEIGLEKKDPQRKLERRRRRQAKTTTLAQTSGLPCPGKVSENDAASASDGCGSPATRSRYIPSEVRERVLERAGHQCEYRGGPDGTRCTERAGLEIEHERPFAIFSSHDERYLRAFCRRHNRLSAERVYGTDFIQGKIDEKRRQESSRGRASQPVTSA